MPVLCVFNDHSAHFSQSTSSLYRVEAKHREMTEACASLKDITKKEHEETRAFVETKAEEVKEGVDEVKQEVKAGVDTLSSQMGTLQEDVKDVKFLLESVKKIAAAPDRPEAADLISSKKELFKIETITLDGSGASLATQSEQDEEIARLKKENDLLRKKSEEERILNEKKRSQPQPQQEVAEEDTAGGSTRPIKKLKSKFASFTDRLPLMGGNPKL